MSEFCDGKNGVAAPATPAPEEDDEYPECFRLGAELMKMVDEGLLSMGVWHGEVVFWPTPLGCEVLGMEPPDPDTIP